MGYAADSIGRYALTQTALSRRIGETRVVKATRAKQAGVAPSARASPGVRVVATEGRGVINPKFEAALDDLRQVAKPALRHRVLLNIDSEIAGLDVDVLLDQLVSDWQSQIA